MKNIWIYNSSDEPMYFSNPKKAYDVAMRFQDEKPKYATLLNHLKKDGYYAFKSNDNSIVKVVVL